MKLKKLFTFTTFLLIQLSYSQVGINTDHPEADLDINGNIAIRDMDVAQDTVDKNFYNLQTDDDGFLYKASLEPNNYSAYLGYKPMAPSHEFEMPTTLQNGYVTSIEGVSIDACTDAPVVTFSMTFKDLNLITGIVERFDKNKMPPYQLKPEDIQRLSNTPLSNLDGESDCSSRKIGHFLDFSDDGSIKVRFKDQLNYYPDAGNFTITKVSKVKYK